MEELSDLHKRGNTIIMVTHNPNLTSYAGRVISMLDGRIATDTKTKKSEKRTSALTASKVPLGTAKSAKTQKKRGKK